MCCSSFLFCLILAFFFPFIMFLYSLILAIASVTSLINLFFIRCRFIFFLLLFFSTLLFYRPFTHFSFLFVLCGKVATCQFDCKRGLAPKSENTKSCTDFVFERSKIELFSSGFTHHCGSATRRHTSSKPPSDAESDPVVASGTH